MKKTTSVLYPNLPPVSTDVVPYKAGPDYYGLSPKEMRQQAPFQPGNVIWVENGDTQQKAVVLDIFREYSKSNFYYYPKYRVAIATKDGKWSEKWCYKFPGDIFRAYKALKICPAEYLA